MRVALLLATLLCATLTHAAPPAILLLGDSLSYFNGGVNATIAALLEERLGLRTGSLEVAMYAKPGYSWKEHAADAIKPGTDLYYLLGPGASRKKWDVVATQGQSNRPALGGPLADSSYSSLKKLAKLAMDRSAQVALIQTWAAFAGDDRYSILNNYTAMQDQLTKSYAEFATSLRQDFNATAFVAPAGLAWQYVYKQSYGADKSGLPQGNGTFPALYFAEDLVHPSRAGTYLQACTIASSITGCTTSGLKANPFGLAPKWLPYLQAVADAVVFKGTPPSFPAYPWAGSAGTACSAA